MKKIFFLFSFLLLIILPSSAQKKEISTASDWVKNNSNLDKAEQSMMNLLKDSTNRRKEKVWSVLFGALQKQYEGGNEKLYLKQNYDTASLFNIASRMFSVMESYDSIESQPDRRGKVKFKYRKQNSSMLNVLRPNLYNGGIFFIHKKDYNSAYRLFNQYIDAANQPLFKSFNYTEKDKKLPEAAYWAVYCGYKLKDTKKVLHHTYLALKDTAHNEPMLQYLAATYQLEEDTTRFVGALRDGFDKYPLSPYFFPHLIEYYSNQGNWKEALALTNKALSADSTNVVFKLTKSSIFLNTGDYQDCFAICESLLKDSVDRGADSISVNNVLRDAYLNAGLAKFNQGVSIDKNIQQSGKRHNEVLQYYKSALPYLEQYRKLNPEAVDKWALPLYTIYLNLNMGKKFDEIDKLLKNK